MFGCLNNFKRFNCLAIKGLLKIKDISRKSILERQLVASEESFINKMKSTSERERDFMRMFKMQVILKENDLTNLDLKFRLRFLCFFFCNFIDKILVMYYFKDFWVDVKIYQVFNTVQTKYTHFF